MGLLDFHLVLRRGGGCGFGGRRSQMVAGKCQEGQLAVVILVQFGEGLLGTQRLMRGGFDAGPVLGGETGLAAARVVRVAMTRFMVVVGWVSRTPRKVSTPDATHEYPGNRGELQGIMGQRLNFPRSKGSQSRRNAAICSSWAWL